jgi:DUF4097 and DUF4098 domain-containing protein YvlB
MEIRAARCARASLAGVLCGAMWLAACDVSIRDGSISVSALSGRAAEEWTRQYPLTQDGRVEVVNINGPIDVVAGPDGVVEVHASRTVRALTDEAARERLRTLTIEETATPSRVRLETRASAPSERVSVEVGYRVSVPRASQLEVVTTNGAVTVTGVRGGVKVSTTNGSVTGDALTGRVDATTVNGAIQVDLEGVGTAGVRLESVNGAVRIRVPEQSRATLSARCVNGHVRVAGLPVQAAGERRARELEVQLNGGGPRIDLRTTNGAITIDGKK